MRALALSLAAASLASAALAQPAPLPQDRTYVSGADLAAMIADGERNVKPGVPITGARILQLKPYVTGLEYRTAVGPASVHEHDAEFFYVLEGSGVLVTGGKLTDEKRINPANLSGSGIQGGAAQKIAKGDTFVVPENTPHWFSVIDGRLVMMSLHMPRPPSAPWP